MDSLPAWFAVVGLGMLHGLSPTSGWPLAAGCGLHAGASARAWRALLPLALGQLGAVLAVALAAGNGWVPDRALAQRLAGAVLLGLALVRPARTAAPGTPPPRRFGSTGLAAWSGLMATAHGTGLMLVPALAPLCAAGGAPRPMGTANSLLLAAAALAAHLAAMLLTTGALAAAVCHGTVRCRGLAGSALSRRACSAAMALTGAWLLLGG